MTQRLYPNCNHCYSCDTYLCDGVVKLDGCCGLVVICPQCGEEMELIAIEEDV